MARDARSIGRDGDHRAPLARLHDAGECAADVEDAVGVDGKNVAPGGVVGLGDKGGGQNAGDVYAVVDRPERALDLGNHGIDRGTVAHVERAGLAAEIGDGRDVEV